MRRVGNQSHIYSDRCVIGRHFSPNFAFLKISSLFNKLHTVKMTEKAEIPSLLKWESFIFMITAPMHKLLMSPPSHRIHSIRAVKSITTLLWSNWNHPLDLMNMLGQHVSLLDQSHRVTKWLPSVSEKFNMVSIEWEWCGENMLFAEKPWGEWNYILFSLSNWSVLPQVLASIGSHNFIILPTLLIFWTQHEKHRHVMGNSISFSRFLYLSHIPLNLLCLHNPSSFQRTIMAASIWARSCWATSIWRLANALIRLFILFSQTKLIHVLLSF